MTLHWCSARPANKPCQKHKHKVLDVIILNSFSEQTAQLYQLASIKFGLKLQSILLLLSNCFANEAHPGTISKSLWYMYSCLQALVSEPSSFCMRMHSTVLSLHGGLDKHAKLGGRWKAACLCLVSLSVCCFCVPQPDWHHLSNNMAGRQFESLVGFYPLKWYSITFWWTFFCSKPHLIMIQSTNAIHIEMLRCLKPDHNNCFDMSYFFSLPWQWH